MEPEILNRLKMGIICVNGQGLIAYYNNAFAGIIREGDGLYIRGDRLSTSPDAQCFLLTDIGETTMKKNLAGIRIIERPSGRLSYQLCYMPLPDSVRDMTGQPVYLIFLFDPETTSNSLARFMELAYGLSKTESRLAAHVCRGLPVEEYAAEENVSVATARTQLRSIYKRTKTKGQARLATLVRGLELLSSPENLEKSKKKKFRRQRDEGLALAQLMAEQKPSGKEE
jgi:DNA-binding CsgD family transcriptional regulator